MGGGERKLLYSKSVKAENWKLTDLVFGRYYILHI